MTTIIQLLEDTLAKVLLTFAHNWPYLLASILIGSLIKLYLDKDRVAGYLQKHQKGGVVLATAVAVGTPLCSCGTTAIVIGMMASMMPWAPIVAFMVSSPLSSPEGMVYSAGLFGWPFAIACFVTSIILGLAGGLIAGLAGAGRLAQEPDPFQVWDGTGRCSANGSETRSGSRAGKLWLPARPGIAVTTRPG